MSNPATDAATQDSKLDDAVDKATQNDESNFENDESVIFESHVAKALKEITRGKDGKYVLPEGVSAEVKFAAISEQRRRDTQSEFTKVAQAKKMLEAENNALKQKAVSEVKIVLSDEQKEELEDLKFSDPEAWRKKMNRYEQDAYTKQTKELNDEIAQVSADTLAKDELERRKEVLEKFNLENPDFELNDEVIQNDIPPRITKRLETGQISFETFLKEVLDYTKTGKVVKQDPTNKDPNLSRVGGGSKPDKHAEKEDIILSYKKEVF